MVSWHQEVFKEGSLRTFLGCNPPYSVCSRSFESRRFLIDPCLQLHIPAFLHAPVWPQIWLLSTSWLLLSMATWLARAMALHPSKRALYIYQSLSISSSSTRKMLLHLHDAQQDARPRGQGQQHFGWTAAADIKPLLLSHLCGPYQWPSQYDSTFITVLAQDKRDLLVYACRALDGLSAQWARCATHREVGHAILTQALVAAREKQMCLRLRQTHAALIRIRCPVSCWLCGCRIWTRLLPRWPWPAPPWAGCPPQPRHEVIRDSGELVKVAHQHERESSQNDGQPQMELIGVEHHHQPRSQRKLHHLTRDVRERGHLLADDDHAAALYSYLLSPLISSPARFHRRPWRDDPLG